MELAQRTATPCGMEVWQVQGLWQVLSVAISFLGCSLAPGALHWARRAARSPEHSRTPPGFGIVGTNSGRCCTRGSLMRRAIIPAGMAGGAGSRLCSLPGAGVARHPAWEGGKEAVGYWPKSLPRAHRLLNDNVEQSCNCCNRHCGWKSFLRTPDYPWEG